MRTLIALVCICILLAFAHIAASIITPLLLALTLAVAFQPIAHGIARRGLPPVVAAALMTIGVLLLVGGLGLLVYMAAIDLIDALPRYQERITELQRDLGAWLSDHGMRDAARSVRRFDVAGPFQQLLTSSLLSAGAWLQTLFLVLVLTAFIQLETRLSRRKLIRAFGSPQPVRGVMAGLREVQRYMMVKFVMSAANGLFLGIWCWLWGVDSPLLWGVVAFALNFIPVIGSIMAAIPPIGLAMLQGGPGNAAGVATGYLLVNLVVDNIIEPRVMGRTLGLSPLVVLLSMLLWGFVLGPVGALLSVPLTMSVKIIFEHDEDLRRVAMIMSDSSDLNPPAAP